MRCPKCGVKLRQVAVISRASGLERASESGFVEGLSCWSCGFWVDAEITVICPMPPKEQGTGQYFPKGMTSVVRGQALQRMVVQYMASIDKLWRAGYNFKNIVKELALPMSHCTLYRYWKIEKGLR